MKGRMTPQTKYFQTVCVGDLDLDWEDCAGTMIAQSDTLNFSILAQLLPNLRCLVLFINMLWPFLFCGKPHCVTSLCICKLGGVLGVRGTSNAFEPEHQPRLIDIYIYIILLVLS